MSKLVTNIFLIATTLNYLQSSAVCKNQRCLQFFSSNIFSAKIEISGTNLVKKTFFFLLLVQTSTSLFRKNRKFQKPRSCKQFKLTFQILQLENQNN